MAQALFLQLFLVECPTVCGSRLVTPDYDVVIIGAGAAGLMCAIGTGK